MKSNGKLNGPSPEPTTERLSHKTLRKGLSFFAATCVVATCGYVAAGWEWIDAIYMVTITIFGVGYGEVKPIEEVWLKFFTMGVIFAGCSSLIYVIGGIVQMLAEGEIESMLGTRHISKEIDKLNDHTIICGYGRVGQMLAVELANQDQPLVVVDRDESKVDLAIADGFLAIRGDAAEDSVLTGVGIHRASTLATVLPHDATNVFITLSARDLCASVCIIARAESPTTERKLMRSGATSVVMPAAIGAVRIAQLATRTDGFDTSGQCNPLSKDRYRILESHSRNPGLDGSPEEIEKVENQIQEEVETLADLASELTHSFVEKQDQQLAHSHPSGDA